MLAYSKLCGFTIISYIPKLTNVLRMHHQQQAMALISLFENLAYQLVNKKICSALKTVWQQIRFDKKALRTTHYLPISQRYLLYYSLL